MYTLSKVIIRPLAVTTERTAGSRSIWRPGSTECGQDQAQVTTDADQGGEETAVGSMNRTACVISQATGLTRALKRAGRRT